MEQKFKTPNIAFQNVISFTCSDDAVKPLIELLLELSSLGQMGCSKKLIIDWDGDGRDKLENISVNGVTLDAWESEFERLNKNNVVETQSQSEQESEEK